MKVKAIYYVAAAIAVIVAGFLAWFLSDEYFAREKAPFQETPDWNEWEKRIPPGESADSLQSNDPRMPIEIQPTAMLRTAGPRLLLKHNYGTEIYAFDPGTRAITRASEDEWMNAGGQIVRCLHEFSPEHNRSVSFDTYPKYEAILNGKKLETYGRYTLFASESPSNTKAALLTASGRSSGPGIGLVGLGGSDPKITGQLYVEVIDVTSGQRTAGPIRITAPENLGNYRLCWAADEQYIVAYLPYENFSVVDVRNISK